MREKRGRFFGRCEDDTSVFLSRGMSGFSFGTYQNILICGVLGLRWHCGKRAVASSRTREFQLERKSSPGFAGAVAVHVICPLDCLSYVCIMLVLTQEGRLRPRFRSGGHQPRRAEGEPLRRFRLVRVVRVRGPAGRLRRQPRPAREDFRSVGRRRVPQGG